MRYDHTQKAPLYLLLLAIGAIMLGVAWLNPQQMVRVLLTAIGTLMILLAFCFQHLTVRDEGDSLLIAFGPMPFFRRSVRYASMTKVEQNRTSILDGWGIHLSPSGGWTWNLWGYDCVDVYHGKKSKVRIGTDDPEGLARFLDERLSLERVDENRNAAS